MGRATERRRIRGALLAIVCALLAAGPAHAETRVEVDGGVLRLTGDGAGEGLAVFTDDQRVVAASYDDTPEATLVAGPGCAVPSDGPPAVVCSALPGYRLEVTLGGGDDVVHVLGAVIDPRTVVEEGAGDDHVMFTGVAGWRVSNGDGDDRFEGAGPGSVPPGPGRDTFLTDVQRPFTVGYADLGHGITVTTTGDGRSHIVEDRGAEEPDRLHNFAGFTGTPHADTLVAAADRSYFDGGGGDDLLRGGGGQDLLLGGPGNDRLFGEEATDGLDGGPGDDELHGGDGNDRVVGGVGDDRLDGGRGDETFTPEPGADRIDGGAGTDRFEVTGRTAGQRLVQNETADDGEPGEHDDLGGDVEHVTGGPGNDELGAGPETKELRGGGGNDTLRGGPPNGQLFGGPGDDALEGGDGYQLLHGEEGDDLLRPAPYDLLDGGPGQDTVDWSRAGAPVRIDLQAGTLEPLSPDGLLADVEHARGGPFDDELAGSDGPNRLDGGPGDDRLAGGLGGDVLEGGEGRDRADYEARAGGVRVTLAGGADDGAAGEGDDVRTEEVVGTLGPDVLVGGPGDDALLGSTGADVLDGGGGDDALLGGEDADRLAGGPGTDAVGAADGDRDTVTCGRGDTVTADAADVTRGCATVVGPPGRRRPRARARARAAVAGGTARGDHLRGGPRGDVLRGRAGPDVLDGRGGADRLFGDTGADLLRGGAGDDRLLGGEAADRLLGGPGDDRLEGQTAGDRLDGGAGRDRLDGGSGDDHARGGPGADTLVGRYGHDELRGGADADVLSGDEAPDLLVGDEGDDDLDGGSGADQLFGADGDDTLAGGSGADVVVAGAGNDRVLVDARRGLDQRVDCGPGVDTVEVTTLNGRRRLARMTIGCEQFRFEDADPDALVGGRTLLTRDGGDVGFGTPLPDKLLGGAGTDLLFGGAGDDLLWGDHRPGTAAADQLFGGDGADTLYGGGAADLLQGDAGDDLLQGDAGDDVLRGGPGRDHLRPAAGRDRVDAGAGDDRIDALIDGADVIDCGPGRDTVRADPADRLRRCERVLRT